MSHNINQDLNRFKQVLKNNVKNNLGKHASSENLISQKDGKIIKIPIDRIDLPRFVYGNNQGGAGQGDGNPGDPIDGSGKPGTGKGKAGKDEGSHAYTAEFTPEELAKMLAEELNLPELENKGKGKTNSVKSNYAGITNNGAEGLRHLRRTYKQSLKRALASGTYNYSNPQIIPIKDDKRYKAPKFKEEPDCNTVAIFMMDVSGSMGEQQKHLVKSQVFWINLWLKNQYKNIETRFIIHDVKAREVNEEEFFSVSESGGTLISSALDKCCELIEKEYPFSDYNIYPFYFSDGDNWDYMDNDHCVKILKEFLLNNCNGFYYGQVAGGSGDFIKVIHDNFAGDKRIRTNMVSSGNEVLNGIKEFFK